MTTTVATRLLEAIAANRLLVACGAGLSMAPPSNLPSATQIARTCSEDYALQTGAPLPATMQHDIAAIAEHFRQEGRFDNFFITTLVPWAQLSSEPNKGHEAIADFLACGVLAGAFTTNFDTLVEQAAARIGEPDFRATVDAQDLVNSTAHRGYLKLHGCANRSRWTTIWCPNQLGDQEISARLSSLRTWLAAQLTGKDLVFVGFWSDWAYLTDLIAEHFEGVSPGCIYLVDPTTEASLREKAPRLWAWAQQDHVGFHHCCESGSDFLEELRKRWSLAYLNRLVRGASASYVDLFGAQPSTLVPGDDMDCATLYALRRDLSGTPVGEVVRDREPPGGDHVAAAIHQRLLERGARYSAHKYSLHDRTIRVVSGRGRLLSQVKAQFQREPPAAAFADDVVCAGAVADASPASIVRGDGPATIVRAGAQGHWTVPDCLIADLREPHD